MLILLSTYKVFVKKLQGEKSEMEFELKTGPQGHVYLPKNIRKVFGPKLKLLPNSNAAVLFPENTTPEAVIASLQVIISDLKLRTNKQKED
jgi:hypothetical protein